MAQSNEKLSVKEPFERPVESSEWLSEFMAFHTEICASSRSKNSRETERKEIRGAVAA